MESGVAGALNTPVLFIYKRRHGMNPQDSYSRNIFASIYFVRKIIIKAGNVGGDEIKYTSNGGAFWGTQFSYPEYLNSVFTDSLERLGRRKSRYNS